MFLVERLPAAPQVRADLVLPHLRGGAGELIRAGLASRPPAERAEPASTWRRESQPDLALPQPARRRKAG
jgi:hypothetical protein